MFRRNPDLRLLLHLVPALVLARAKRKRTISIRRGNERLRRRIVPENDKRDKMGNRQSHRHTNNRISNRSPCPRHLFQMYQRHHPTRRGIQTRQLRFSWIQNLHATLLSHSMSTLPRHVTIMHRRCLRLQSFASAQHQVTGRLRGIRKISDALPVYITHNDQHHQLSASTHRLGPTYRLKGPMLSLNVRLQSRPSVRHTMPFPSLVRSPFVFRSTESPARS